VIPDADVLAAVAARGEAVSEVVGFVHAHPELGHEERECSAFLCETLEAAGLAVERGVGGMETAFRATLDGSRPGRSVGPVCLYDAVPAVREDGRVGPVHSCGHGPIGGGVTGAALALSELATGSREDFRSWAARPTRSMRRGRPSGVEARRSAWTRASGTGSTQRSRRSGPDR
jgi:metal-dependent amidase/aminoacylase/carboxypeptidase family protein